MKKISTPQLAFIAVLLSTSVLFAGCKQVGQQAQNAVQEVVQNAQAALLSESDLAGIKDPLIRKHFVAQANAGAYRAVTTSSGRGEGTTTTEIMISGNEVKFHTLLTMNSKTSQEMIVIGDTTYVKDPSGNWWKQVNKKEENKEDSQGFTIPDINGIKEEFTKKQENTEFKSLGTESCGTAAAAALTCYKYQETSGVGDDVMTRTFWFDNQNFLLRKEEQKFGEFTTTSVMSYDGINIAPPAPTKDVPEGKSVFEYLTSVTSSGMEAQLKQLDDSVDVDQLDSEAEDF